MTHLTSEQQAQQKHAARAKRRYVKLTYNGSSCIFPPDQIPEWPEEEGAVPKMEDVLMTQAEFEALPEFQGY